MLRRFIVLDMDRTLFDTAEYAAVLMEALGLSKTEERLVKSVLEREYGKNFDLLTYLLELKGISFASAEQRVINRSEQHKETLLMPGVSGLIAALDEAGENYGVLTTGTQQNQQL